METTQTNQGILPLVEKLEAVCRKYPWTTLAVSFGAGVGIGVSPFASLVPRAFALGVRKLAAVSTGSAFTAISMTSLATEFVSSAVDLVKQGNGATANSAV